MPTLPFDFPLYAPLALHCVIGGVATVIAQSKGRRFETWLLWGLIGGTVALIAAIALKPEEIQ